MSEAAPTRHAAATVLLTGGAGFIGANLVRWLLENEPRLSVIVLDALTYAGNVASLAAVARRHGPAGDGRFHFVHGDIGDPALLERLVAGGAAEPSTGRRLPQPDTLLHLAAESHVDRSILGPAAFVATNVQGTLALLEATRRELTREPRAFRFVNVSTDEVYGSLGADDPAFTEQHPLQPNSPYSASKAGADCLVRAYTETFSLPCVTTRCSNNYGPLQFPEKLIPLMITRALADQPLPVYGDGGNVRDWLHVDDHCAAIWAVATRGRTGAVYNVGGNAERRNLDVVRTILATLGKPDSLIRFVPDRLGHDRRYAMDSRLLARELDWQPSVDFEAGLRRTVDWYVGHRDWWEPILGEEHRRWKDPYAVLNPG
jgi:dTDP-glucose 4,6-dehydratase